MSVVIKRALLSCHDKTGLDVLAKGLAALGVELVASGGTAAFLQQQGLAVKTVEAFAGIPEQLDGRVKTLHPKIHAGILARREDPAHVKAVGPSGLIDLVVVNLYPFSEVSQRPGVTLQEALEQIDIGGVALLRAAAKNFPSVAVASRPQQYADLLAALQQGTGTVSETLTRQLAGAAFELTSRYDTWIASFVSGSDRITPDASPERVTLSVQRHQPLRYGENPHQQAAWYIPVGAPAGLATLTQVQGKELSYNNLLDLDTVIRCLADFSDPTCVIVKHASPCGVATGRSIFEAYQQAFAGDAESAFGGIVGFNRPLDISTATEMSKTFLEMIAAPSIDQAINAVFAKKPNLRVVIGECSKLPGGLEWHSVVGGWLAQARDASVVDSTALRVATTCQPTEAQHRDALFAWTVAKHVKSNAIVIAKDGATIGIGQGQPSRVRAVRLAIQNAGERCGGAVLASDGFFPFPDSVELAAKAGISAIIQPGGSMKDLEVIAAANHAGVPMLLTGVRHFRH